MTEGLDVSGSRSESAAFRLEISDLGAFTIRAPIGATPPPVPAGCRRTSYDDLGVTLHPSGSDPPVPVVRD
jgi:hypothetical protein